MRVNRFWTRRRRAISNIVLRYFSVRIRSSFAPRHALRIHDTHWTRANNTLRFFLFLSGKRRPLTVHYLSSQTVRRSANITFDINSRHVLWPVGCSSTTSFPMRFQSRSYFGWQTDSRSKGPLFEMTCSTVTLGEICSRDNSDWIIGETESKSYEDGLSATILERVRNTPETHL